MAKREVLWTDTARFDLENLIEYIADENPTSQPRKCWAGSKTRRAHWKRRRSVAASFPELRAVGVQHYRELVERPWRIVYRTEATRVLVLAVLDSRRDLQSLLLERLIRS